MIRRVLKLFVDDWTLAGAVAAWLLLAWAFLPREWGGPVLFGGLAVILLENTSRKARGSAPGPELKGRRP